MFQGYVSKDVASCAVCSDLVVNGNICCKEKREYSMHVACANVASVRRLRRYRPSEISVPQTGCSWMIYPSLQIPTQTAYCLLRSATMLARSPNNKTDSIYGPASTVQLTRSLHYLAGQTRRTSQPYDSTPPSQAAKLSGNGVGFVIIMRGLPGNPQHPMACTCV